MSKPPHMTTGRYAPPAPERELTARSADGAPLHVELFGPADAPAVVLAHGWTCAIPFWAAQIRALAEDHHVIAYDQRGHGRSPAPTGPAGYTSRALADDLQAVLAAALEPGRRAVVVGHSMGGMTIMAAARGETFREHTAAALLCSTGGSRLTEDGTVVPLPPGPLRTRLTRAVLGSSAPLGPVTPSGRRVLRYATMGRGATPEMTEACARIVHGCPRRVRQRWARLFEGLDLTAGIAGLTVPTAVLAGGADRLTPPVHARRTVAALPRCAGLTELPGIGHMTPVEAPDAVSGLIRDLVATHVQRKGVASS